MNKKELIEYKTPNSKTCLKKDGTIQVEIYDENIHYLKDGKYEDIDNTLLATEDGYTNKKIIVDVQLFQTSYKYEKYIYDSKYDTFF